MADYRSSFRFGTKPYPGDNLRGPRTFAEVESRLLDNVITGISSLGEIQAHEFPDEELLDWKLSRACELEDWKNLLAFGYFCCDELGLFEQ